MNEENRKYRLAGCNMGRHAGYEWLKTELPGLAKAGVLDNDAADRIKRHYETLGHGPAPGSRAVLVVAVFSAMGAVMVGLGVILLFAHNWNQLSIGTRTVLSFVPLVIGQALVGWSIVRRRESLAWRESTGAFTALMIGSTIALIGQTYHIPGNLASFLLTWCLLGLPLAYLLDALLPTLLYLAGITAWAGAEQSQAGHALGFYPLALLIMPQVMKTIWRGPNSPRSLFATFGSVICATVSLGVVLEKSLPGLWIVLYLCLFASMGMAGHVMWRDSDKLQIWQVPLRFVGLAGLFVVSIILSYEWPWDDIGWQHYRSAARFHAWASTADYVLLVALLAVTLALGVRMARQWAWLPWQIALATAPVLGVVGYAFASMDDFEAIAILIFNAYLVVVGVLMARAGARGGNLAMLNQGLCVLALWATLRFFDADLDFVTRGVAFILLGTAFLGVNGFTLWRKRRLER